MKILKTMVVQRGGGEGASLPRAPRHSAAGSIDRPLLWQRYDNKLPVVEGKRKEQQSCKRANLKMNGGNTRNSKLRNVRLTLSKLDAKYSKSSALVDDEDSSPDLDGSDDLLKHTIPPASPEHISEVKPEEQHQQQQHDDSDSSVQMISVMRPASVLDRGSPSVDDNTSLDTASSIESVKTESILGFNNVHSVSSLADSVPRSDEIQQRISMPLVSARQQKSQSTSSSTSAEVQHKSIFSEKNPAGDTSSNSFSLKSIQRQMTPPSSESKTVENTIEPYRQDDEQEPPGFTKINFPTNIIHEQAQGKSDARGYVSRNTLEKENSQAKTIYHCECNKLLKLKRKSIAVQTHSLSHQEMESSLTKNKTRRHLSATEYSTNTPLIKATKLPHCFDNLVPPTKTRADLQEGAPGASASDSMENELSKLISHHLYLTKEFLERQHRMYLANCKAVQLLEKGYQENMLHDT